MRAYEIVELQRTGRVPCLGWSGSPAPAQREGSLTMANIFYEKDADPNLIGGRKVAVIGYGSQGTPTR